MALAETVCLCHSRRVQQVDLTYRSELREQNEINFARFDAKLEQCIAELRAEFHADLHTGLNSVHGEIHGLRTELHALKAELIKWMFLFWAGTALAGLLLRV